MTTPLKTKDAYWDEDGNYHIILPNDEHHVYHEPTLGAVKHPDSSSWGHIVTDRGVITYRNKWSFPLWYTPSPRDYSKDDRAADVPDVPDVPATTLPFGTTTQRGVVNTLNRALRAGIERFGSDVDRPNQVLMNHHDFDGVEAALRFIGATSTMRTEIGSASCRERV